MLPPDIQARVAAIAADFESGASELTMRALEAFEALAARAPPPEEIRELAAKLDTAQPNMASVRNVARLAVRLVLGSPDASAALREVRREISGAPEKIARTALKVINGKPTIVTLSRSLAVTTTLKFLQTRRMLGQVFVLESRPGLEGRRTAAELSAAGIPTKLVTDGQGPEIVRRSDLVLTGADTILLDGSLVNKVGTLTLAQAANAANKSFHAVCETLKIDPVRTRDTFRPTAVGPSDDLDGVGGSAETYFDVTPPELVTSFITDRGIYEPTAIVQLWTL